MIKFITNAVLDFGINSVISLEMDPKSTIIGIHLFSFSAIAVLDITKHLFFM